MTGETGAGKSILVDALGLALGRPRRRDGRSPRRRARRDQRVVRRAEGTRVARYGSRERGLDDDTACTLRRLVGSDGRSRAFINGQPVNLQDLKALGGLLVDIHGQHAHQSLARHRQSARAARRARRARAARHKPSASISPRGTRSSSSSRTAARRARNDNAEIELLRFQVAELEALALGEGEPERLRAERDRLANTDRLLSGASAALDALAENETASAYSAVVRRAARDRQARRGRR